MKKVTFIFLLIMCLTLYSCFKYKAEQGTIVLLNGTSSAGKTTIIKELQKIYGDTYEFLLGDEFVVIYGMNHPELESMKVDDAQKQIISALLVYVKQLSLKGKNVLVETVEFDNNYEKYCAILNCDNVVKILVYCPLDIIIEHIEKRNKSSDEKEKRDFLPPFQQFPAMYKLQESADEMVVDRIQTKRMKNALGIVAQHINRLIKEAGAPGSFEESHDYKNFVEQFKLDTHDEIILVPKHKWDLMVNAGIHSSVEIAQEIAQYLKVL